MVLESTGLPGGPHFGGRNADRDRLVAPQDVERLLPLPNGRTARRYGSITTTPRSLVFPWLLLTDVSCPNSPPRSFMFQPRRAIYHGSTPVRYVEFHCRTNFSFLEGASHPDELVARRPSFGYAGLAITDRNSLAGAVRAHVAAREAGLKLIVGSESHALSMPAPILLWAMNRRRLWPALSALDPRASSGPQGRMSPLRRGCRRAHKWFTPSAYCCRPPATPHRN